MQLGSFRISMSEYHILARIFANGGKKLEDVYNENSEGNSQIQVGVHDIESMVASVYQLNLIDIDLEYAPEELCELKHLRYLTLYWPLLNYRENDPTVKKLRAKGVVVWLSGNRITK